MFTVKDHLNCSYFLDILHDIVILRYKIPTIPLVLVFIILHVLINTVYAVIGFNKKL